MALQPFIWDGKGKATSPEAVARERAIAAALANGALQPAQNVGEGLSAIGRALAYRNVSGRADEAAGAGQSKVAAALAAARAGGDPSAYLDVLADPWASQSQQSVAQALYGQTTPDAVLDRTYKEAQIDALKAKPAAPPVIVPAGSTVLDPLTKQPVYTAPPKAPDTPNGYRVAGDGTTLEYIPGGPADPSTAGKTTEATRRNQQLASVIVPELASLVGDGTPQNPGTFDALTNGYDIAKDQAGPMARAIGLGPSAEYQQAQNSLKTIIASYLYSVSGATANPGEVETQASVLTPKLNESPQSVAAKKARIAQMVEAVKAAATGTPIDVEPAAAAPGPTGMGQPDADGFTTIAPGVRIKPVGE